MRKVIVSGVIGNVLEWYDFALYGHFAILIGKLFLPTKDPQLATILAYTIFAIGFTMRPVGGILFGYIGDKYGRRTSLAISILMMAIPTACIGLLPTYEQIGILAPILLIVIRLLQGASIGGEFSGCIAFLVEYSPANRRGLVGSLSMMSLAGGMLLGSIVATAVSHFMAPEAFEVWGWRIPFLVGLFVGLIGVYVRMGLDESPIYMESKARNSLSDTPVREVIKNYMPELLLSVGIYLTVTVPFYTLTIFMKSYMSSELGYSYNDSLIVNLISLSVAIIAMPIGAWVSDRYGRKPVLKYTAIAMVICMYPIFWLVKSSGFEAGVISQLIFSVLVGFYMGPMPAALVELFPTRVRFTGVAVSYNLSVAAFGSTTPAVATWLVGTTGHYSVALYVIFFVIMTLFTLKYYQESYRKILA